MDTKERLKEFIVKLKALLETKPNFSVNIIVSDVVSDMFLNTETEEDPVASMTDFFVLVHKIIADSYPKCSVFSGNYEYPVSSPSKRAPSIEFWLRRTQNKIWEDEYGVRYTMLFNTIIEHIEKEIYGLL